MKLPTKPGVYLVRDGEIGGRGSHEWRAVHVTQEYPEDDHNIYEPSRSWITGFDVEIEHYNPSREFAEVRGPVDPDTLPLVEVPRG